MSKVSKEDDYKEYRKSLDEALGKCEDEFEKKITYLAAGALGLSFTFISDIVNFHNSKCMWVLLLGWLLLVVCLAVNLVSQLRSGKHIENTRKECDKKVSKGDNYNPDPEKIEKRNKEINIINILTTIFFIIGVVFILTYVGINMFKFNV